MMALSVIMFAIVPDYTTFGSQHFVVNVTLGNSTEMVTKKIVDHRYTQGVEGVWGMQ